ncbi:LPXTG cell wall anchor domain-containing protein [Curtobacterium aurantiacum]|nr:LPXTG cell wall anchor domain-containing protein [Curtobacterium flaccumfaciens]MBT1675062.1 LPXTG cell wall anchor domain-containing protein [Curtobacterium flaccumfaciens pv. flaccumfaciens]
MPTGRTSTTCPSCTGHSGYPVAILGMLLLTGVLWSIFRKRDGL